MIKRIFAAAMWALAATGVAWAGDGNCQIVQNLTRYQTDVRPCLPFALPAGGVTRCLNCPGMAPTETNSGQALCVTVQPEFTANIIPGHLVHGRCVPDVPAAIASNRAVNAVRPAPVERGIVAPPRFDAPAPPRFSAPSRFAPPVSGGALMRASAMSHMPIALPHVSAPAASSQKP
jgi:hypothetical protein